MKYIFLLLLFIWNFSSYGKEDLDLYAMVPEKPFSTPLFQDLEFTPLTGDHLFKNMSFAFEMEGKFFSSQFEKTQYGRIKTKLTTYHNFHPRLDLHLSGFFQYAEGAYQYFSPLNKSIRSGFYLDDVYFRWKNLKDSISVQLGMLNQGSLQAPTLVSDLTFIGLREEWVFVRNLNLPFLRIGQMTLSLQQMIPSGQIELNRFNLVKDTSGFYTGSLFMNGQLELASIPSINRNIDFNSNVTLFGYKDLPADAAAIGRIYSNSVVDRYEGADSEFKYPFFGIYSHIGFKTPLFTKVDLEVKTSYLWNLGVLTKELLAQTFNYEGMDKAQTLLVSLHFHRPHFTIVPNLEYFVNHPNASPAKYNDSRYSHSNTKGFIFGIKALLHEYQLAAELNYAVIENVVQLQSNSNINYMTFSIGTDYEI